MTPLTDVSSGLHVRSRAEARESLGALPPARALVGIVRFTVLIVVAGLLVADPAQATTESTPVASLAPDSVGAVAFGSPGGIMLVVLVVLMVAGLTALATTALCWMLYIWRTPQAESSQSFAVINERPRRSFSLIVTAFDYNDDFAASLDEMASIDYPDFEVIAVVGHDDADAAEAVVLSASRHPSRVRFVVDRHRPTNSPRALNEALAHCRGDIVAVFAGGDQVHTELLQVVDAHFSETDADVVQGGVQLISRRTSWYSLRTVIESYFWFRSQMHFHAAHGFVPLSDDTIFVRHDVLNALGGWDPDCLAPHVDLGVRLAACGAKVATAYDDELLTFSGCPTEVDTLLHRRAARDHGLVQVLRKGDWRSIRDGRQRRLTGLVLALPMLRAAAAIVLPVMVLALFLSGAPAGVMVLAFVPVVPVIMMVAVELVGLADFGHTVDAHISLRNYARLGLGRVPFEALLVLAAVRAVFAEVRGDPGRPGPSGRGATVEGPATAAGLPERHHQPAVGSSLPHRHSTTNPLADALTDAPSEDGR
jgi:hypothetical protein